MFRKKKHKSESLSQEKAAAFIAGVIRKTQLSFAAFMTKITGRLAPAAMKRIVLVFFIISGGYSIYLIADALNAGGHKNKTFRVDRLPVPGPYDETDTIKENPVITGSEFEQLQLFHLYIDSLKSDSGGRKIYDSIYNVRPGLMDSVIMLEEIYKQQLQMKN